MSEMLPDEACHVSDKLDTISFSELLEKDFSGSVTLHNTMRFDVQFPYIQPMLDDGDVDKSVLVEAIRNAIVNAVDDVVGKGLDGVPIPGGAGVLPVTKSRMLHREKIYFDLS